MKRHIPPDYTSYVSVVLSYHGRPLSFRRWLAASRQGRAMSYRSEREEFLRRTAGGILADDVAYGLLRAASTLQRLAEAQCNGDYPADDGRATGIRQCPRCESGWHARVITAKGCPDCRTEDRVIKLLARSGWMPVFGGDPRGAVLRIVPEGTAHEDIDSGRERGIYVPARSR